MVKATYNEPKKKKRFWSGNPKPFWDFDVLT